jgi:uncharacterized protein (UPF0276 family)
VRTTTGDRGRLVPDLPLLGLGISSSADEALTLARGRLTRRWPGLDRLGFLNIGLNGATELAPELPELLDDAALACVAHLEDINLVDELDEERLAHVVDCCRRLRPRWLQEDLGVWVWRGTPLVDQMIPPIFDEPSLAVAARNIERISERAGLPFLAENPPVHYVLGDIDLLSFMGRLSERTGCGLILDIGHLASYCICTGRDAIAYLAAWDGFDRVREVHLAGSDTFETSRGLFWNDSHHLPLVAQSLEILDAIMARAASVSAITVEVEGAPAETLWDNLRRVDERVELR